MDNLIYRQAALDMVNHLTEIYVNNLPPMLDKADVYDNLRLLPSADVQPVRHGHWTLQEDRTKKLYGWHICSECGAWIGEPTNYCSNCGADMRGEQNDG